MDLQDKIPRQEAQKLPFMRFIGWALTVIMTLFLIGVLFCKEYVFGKIFYLWLGLIFLITLICGLYLWRIGNRKSGFSMFVLNILYIVLGFIYYILCL